MGVGLRACVGEDGCICACALKGCALKGRMYMTVGHVRVPGRCVVSNVCTIARACVRRYAIELLQTLMPLDLVRWSRSRPLFDNQAVAGEALLGLPTHHVLNRSTSQALPFAGGRLHSATALTVDEIKWPLRAIRLPLPGHVSLDLPATKAVIGVVDRHYMTDNLMFLVGLLLALAAAGVFVAICWRLVSASSKERNMEEEGALGMLRSSMRVACRTLSFCALWVYRCVIGAAAVLHKFFKDKMA